MPHVSADCLPASDTITRPTSARLLVGCRLTVRLGRRDVGERSPLYIGVRLTCALLAASLARRLSPCESGTNPIDERPHTILAQSLVTGSPHSHPSVDSPHAHHPQPSLARPHTACGRAGFGPPATLDSSRSVRGPMLHERPRTSLARKPPAARIRRARNPCRHRSGATPRREGSRRRNSRAERPPIACVPEPGA